MEEIIEELRERNEPVPVPSLVLLSAMVGLPVVFQHTPRAVTVLPPSEVTVPPHVADVAAICVTAAVVTVGVVSVENSRSLP